MAYRFRVRETVRAGIRRIVREQIDLSIRDLKDPRQGGDRAVHEARKRFKRIRAVLRLVRDPLGPVFDRENVWYRDAGRGLSALRDARALLETCDRLLKRFLGSPEARWIPDLRSALEHRREGAGLASGDSRRRRSAVVRRLQAARSRVSSWPVPPDGFATLAPGLERSFAQAAKRFREVEEDPTPRHFHEWRKRVKDCWHQAEILEPTWPEILSPHAVALHRLSELLGENQDLEILRAILAEDPGLAAFSTASDLTVLFQVRQRELQAGALLLGRRLHAELPSSFAERVAAYWSAWREEAPRS